MASLGNIENEDKKPATDSESWVAQSVARAKAKAKQQQQQQQPVAAANVTTIDPEQIQTSLNLDVPSQSNQSSLKFASPAMTRDMTLPKSGKKVPMIMVPVPDTGHLLAIPLSAINQYKDSNQMLDCVTKDEQQARDLLNWNDGIGTLDGCDLRFKINELGVLELIDSDDDNENYRQNKKQQQQTTMRQTLPPVRQISPGSSLLRDGPDHRRHTQRSVKQHNNHHNNSHQHNLNTNHQHNMLLSEKVVPKEVMKANVDQWTIEDVKKFIDGIPGCEGYGKLFEFHQICGESLVCLDQRDLLDIINVKLGPAVKIFNAITLLRSRSRGQ